MVTKYQLSLHAQKLRRGFLGRRPAPYAIVAVNGNDIGRTEIHEPTLSPDWCVSLKLEFSAEMRVPFTVSIHNWCGDQDDKLIARTEFEASEVFNSPGHMQMKEDSNGTQ